MMRKNERMKQMFHSMQFESVLERILIKTNAAEEEGKKTKKHTSPSERARVEIVMNVCKILRVYLSDDDR